MINIYVADITNLYDTYEEKRQIVHCQRIKKIDACKVEADKVRGLGAGLLLEKGLEDYLEMVNLPALPKDEADRNRIEYEYGPQGKPFLKDYPGVFFNLSHSGNLVVLAISEEEIGIDVQENRGIQERMIKRFFHQEENKLFEKDLDANVKEALFYKIWTGKEAYIKYTGLGMKQDLRNFYWEQESGMIYDSDVAVAKCESVNLRKEGYFCATCFSKNRQKIYKITKIIL